VADVDLIRRTARVFRKSGNWQASPDLATLEAAVAAALQDLK